MINNSHVSPQPQPWTYNATTGSYPSYDVKQPGDSQFISYYHTKMMSHCHYTIVLCRLHHMPAECHLCVSVDQLSAGTHATLTQHTYQ